MTATLQSLAEEMLRAIETATRQCNGESFLRLKEDAPAWMTAVCRFAHDDANLLPDDWRYVFIEDAVIALADYKEAEEARDSLEPDVYTRCLTAWLHSSNFRVNYLRPFGKNGPKYDPFGTVSAGNSW